MKKLFIILFAIVAIITLPSFTVDNSHEKSEGGNEFIFYTEITGWKSPTESNKYSIYYQDGLDGRVYYLNYRSNEYCSISDNEYYNSPVCNDYRTRFRYISNGVYFNCDLPNRAKEDNGGFIFFTQIKGWNSAVDSNIYSIYYKEGNGARVYYVKRFSNEYWGISNNKYYNDPGCSDYRKNYRYVSDRTYFNCDLPFFTE